MKRKIAYAFATSLLAFSLLNLNSEVTQKELPSTPKEKKESVEDTFLKLVIDERSNHDAIFNQLSKAWKPSYNAMALEAIRFGNYDTRGKLLFIMEKQYPQANLQNWKSSMQWLWNQPDQSTQGYADFKSKLYRSIDKKFEHYFDINRNSTIRLDEVVWGGVVQDGIPPLRFPKMLKADEADYLNPDDVVFGIEINGDARAYPKRILAWHEMFVDKVGGIDVAGVYCTLCGSVILYETHVKGVDYEMGTSGFLYRSNKLMYDQATQSLWNTLKGEPVVGPLVGKNIKLPRGSVVTTDWKTWKAQHPDTKVLSLDTGHRRDYGEGVAYKDYFATDELMFPVPLEDKRQKNKAEVLSLLLGEDDAFSIAITARFLNENPLYPLSKGEQHLIILTDAAGANRVYENPKNLVFKEWDQRDGLVDDQGIRWTLTEEKLVSSNNKTLKRFPAHRAFWFGWHAAFPETQLIE